MKTAKVQAEQFEKGMLLQEVLIGIFLISLLGATCLKIFSQSTKELYLAANTEVLEAEISKSIAAIYSAQQLSTDLFGTPLYKWRNLAEPQPEYINSHIKSLSETQKPKAKSTFIEITETGNTIFHCCAAESPLAFQGEVFKSSLLSELKEDHWLTISPLTILRWNGVPKRQFLSGETWIATLSTSFPKIEILHHENESEKNDLGQTSLLTPLMDHYILYVSSANELRRSSLLKSDNQPLAVNISNISKHNNECVIYGLRGKAARQTRFPCRTKMTDAYMRMDALDL